jgi:hypothetical protein
LRALDSKQERLFLWLLSFVALDKRKLPAALAAEAFDPACSFEALELLKPEARSTAFVRKRPSYFLLSKATKER